MAWVGWGQGGRGWQGGGRREGTYIQDHKFSKPFFDFLWFPNVQAHSKIPPLFPVSPPFPKDSIDAPRCRPSSQAPSYSPSFQHPSSPSFQSPSSPSFQQVSWPLLWVRILQPTSFLVLFRVLSRGLLHQHPQKAQQNHESNVLRDANGKAMRSNLEARWVSTRSVASLTTPMHCYKTRVEKILARLPK